MGKFFKKTTLFSIPFLIFIIGIVAIDPYNYFNYSRIISDEVKKSTSQKLQYCLWKMIDFKRQPCPNILLGDSRPYAIKTGKIYEIAGQPWFNFAYGGGSLPEIIKTFWYAVKIADLKNVYIGLNFNLYNSFNCLDRVTEAKNIIHNPFLYFCNTLVVKASYYCLVEQLLHKDAGIGKPAMEKEAFWRVQLGITTNNFYGRYQYPTRYFQELEKIAEYCSKNKINLIFIIFPTHIDLQKRVADYNLSQQEKQFKDNLAKLGIVYDFDYPNEITLKKYNFTDPYHCNSDISDQIVEEIWGKKVQYARIIGSPYSESLK